MITTNLTIPGAEKAHLPTVDLSPQAAESTYFIARILMDASNFLLRLIGQEHNVNLQTAVYASLVFLVSLGVGYILKLLIVFISRRLGKHLNSDIYHLLLRRRFFTKACRIVPALVFLILIELTLTHRITLSTWLTRLTWIYIVFVVAQAFAIVADVLWVHIDARENTRKLPLKGIVQLIKGAIWIICTIIVCAILLNKSPGTLLAGLGAFAAVLMLIFKDSILGLVAGVQLSENDSLHVGDWIKVHGTEANGTVEEVTLTSVKIRNWDKTITTVPPYTLISGSFTNYRSMSASNTRRIQRSIYIDADSVIQCDDTMLDSMEQLPLVGDWIKKKREQKAAGKVEDVNNSEGLVDGTIDTNLGVFRAYAKLYLDSNPHIAPETDINFCFVSTLPQTSVGIPFQVYCFTNTSSWLVYEAIQDIIFEHLLSMLHNFMLYTFEYPTGRDTLLDGWMSPGKNPDVVFGLPYPFFRNTGTPHNPGQPVEQSTSPQPASMMPPPPAKSN